MQPQAGDLQVAEVPVAMFDKIRECPHVSRLDMKRIHGQSTVLQIEFTGEKPVDGAV